MALDHAQALLDQKAPPRRTSEPRVAVNAVPSDLFDHALAAAAKTANLLASSAIVRCVEAAATRPFAEGEALEARLFEECRVSPTSQALRHLFFAERQAAKIPGLARAPVRKLFELGRHGQKTGAGYYRY